MSSLSRRCAQRMLLWLVLPVSLGLALPAAALATSPSVQTMAPSSVTGTTATLNATVNAEGQPNTTFAFEYDTTRDPWCANRTPSTQPEGQTTVGTYSDGVDHTVSTTLSGFSPGASICYAIVANPGANTEVDGNTVSFSFTSVVATAGSASSLPNAGATFSGSVNPEGESGLSYDFVVGTPSSGTCSGAAELVGEQSLPYSDSSSHTVSGSFIGPDTGGGSNFDDGLTPGTTYCFGLRVLDSNGDLFASSNFVNFTTSPPVHLSVNVTGGNYGEVYSSSYDYGNMEYQINCGFSYPASSCQGTYVQGTVPVTLHALAANGEGILGRFDGWSGACSGTSPTCTVMMSADRTVGAAFTCVHSPLGCGGPSGPSGPSSSAVGSAVSSALKVAAKIAAILKAGGYQASVSALTAGTLTITWSSGSGTHATRKVVVASGSKTFSKAGKAKLKIKLTRAGKTLLKRSKHLKLTVSGVFKPKSGKKVTKTRTVTLKR